LKPSDEQVNVGKEEKVTFTIIILFTNLMFFSPQALTGTI